MSRLTPAGAAALEDLLASVDAEMQLTARAAVAQHVDAFHRAPQRNPRRLFAQQTIPDEHAFAIAERLDAQPDLSIAALAEEFGYPPALVEYTVAELSGDHSAACRAVQRR